MACIQTISRRALPALMVVFLASCAWTPRVYTDLSAGRIVEPEQVYGAIDGKRVVFVGEAHDSQRDHAAQLALITWLVERGQRVAVALEMFSPSAQKALDDWTEGRLDEMRFVDVYDTQWEMPYEYYRDIFMYARRHRIRLYGINADRRYVAAIARKGLKDVPAGELEKLRFTTCEEEPTYAAAIGMAGMSSRHGTMGHLCDAQRFRDSMLAYNLSQILATGKQDVLVVLMGTGHAMRQAVPSLLAKHTDALYTVLLPAKIRMLTGRRPGAETADFTW